MSLRPEHSALGNTTYTVLLVFLLLAGSLGVGFRVGSNVLGGQYLRRTAAPLRQFPSLPTPPAATGLDAQLSALDDEGPLASPHRPVRDVFAPRTQPGQHVQRAVSPPPTRPKSGRYTVQMGVFVKPENSQALLDDLRNRGYAGRVAIVEEEGERTHRVQMGSFSSQQEAERAARELQEQGYRVRVTPE